MCHGVAPRRHRWEPPDVQPRNARAQYTFEWELTRMMCMTWNYRRLQPCADFTDGPAAIPAAAAHQALTPSPGGMRCVPLLLLVAFLFEAGVAQNVLRHKKRYVKSRRRQLDVAGATCACGGTGQCGGGVCVAASGRRLDEVEAAQQQFGRQLFGAPTRTCQCQMLPPNSPPPASPPPSPAPPAVSCNTLWDHGLREDGVYTIAMNDGRTVPVFCNLTDPTGAWTLVARIAANSRKHMVSAAYGEIASPSQTAPWKLSSADINELRSRASRFYPFRFYCEGHSLGNGGYAAQTPPTNPWMSQFFSSGCSFDADSVASGACQDWFDGPNQGDASRPNSGDVNSCGLGSHCCQQQVNSYAAYGWHGCNIQSSIASESEVPFGAATSATGCGNNGNEGLLGGNGHLWIG